MLGVYSFSFQWFLSYLVIVNGIDKLLLLAGVGYIV